jgi:hypothetical protein
MAEVLPFRAWRFNETLLKAIDHLTSPLLEVASEKQPDFHHIIQWNFPEEIKCLDMTVMHYFILQ